MFVLRSREQIESALQADLDQAQDWLDCATPAELAEAQERFRQTLRRFAAFVLDGEVPKDLRCA